MNPMQAPNVGPGGADFGNREKLPPQPPLKMVVSFGDGSERRRTAVNKKQVRQYHKDNAFSMARTGGLFTVTDASGRDVTSEVL